MRKSFAEFFAEAKNKVRIILCRGVYLAQNALQTASVEFVAESEQIMRAADCKNLPEKPVRVFRQEKLPPGKFRGAAIIYHVGPGVIGRDLIT